MNPTSGHVSPTNFTNSKLLKDFFCEFEGSRGEMVYFFFYFYERSNKTKYPFQNSWYKNHVM